MYLLFSVTPMCSVLLRITFWSCSHTGACPSTKSCIPLFNFATGRALAGWAYDGLIRAHQGASLHVEFFSARRILFVEDKVSGGLVS